MSLRTIVDVLRRRWLPATVALLLVAASAGLAVRATPPTYSYSSSVLLLPPEVSRGVSSGQLDFTQGNPLFYLGSLGQAKDILIASLSSKQTSDAVLAEFPTVTYEAASDVLNTGPIVVITTDSSSEAEAEAALSLLTDRVDQNLASLQKALDIKPQALISSHVLTRDSTPEVSYTGSIRAGVVVGGGLMLVLFFLLSLLDSLLLRRKQGVEGATATVPVEVRQQPQPPQGPTTGRPGARPAARPASKARGSARGSNSARTNKSKAK